MQPESLKLMKTWTISKQDKERVLPRGSFEAARLWAVSLAATLSRTMARLCVSSS